MSAEKFNCPNCQQKLEAPEELQGQVINCPACQQSLQVPKRPDPPRLALSGSRLTQAGSAPPQPVPKPDQTNKPEGIAGVAPLGPRIGAKVLDVVLLTVAMVALAYGSHYLVRTLHSNGVSRETQYQVGTAILYLTVALPFLYHLVLLCGSGATLGKQTFGLVVVRQNGQPMGWAVALVRCLIEFACVGAGFGLATFMFVGVTRHQIYAPGPHRYDPEGMFPHLFLYFLALASYIPAFFNRNRLAVHDMIAQSLVKVR